MFVWLIAFIITALLLMIVLAYAGYITYKWFQYAFNTPAPEFLKARKAGKMMGIQFHQSGAARFKASEYKEDYKRDDSLSHIAPYSTFLEPKSKLLITSYFVSPGVSGKTISPEFVSFTNEVERRVQEQGIDRTEAINQIEKEQEDDGKVQTQFGPVSFAHVRDYLNYSDATANWNTANKIAAVLNRSGMGDILKTIIYIVIALAAFGALLGILFIFYKIFFTQPVNVSVDAVTGLKDAAVNATQTAAQNMTTMQP